MTSTVGFGYGFPSGAVAPTLPGSVMRPSPTEQPPGPTGRIPSCSTGSPRCWGIPGEVEGGCPIRPDLLWDGRTEDDFASRVGKANSDLAFRAYAMSRTAS